MIFGKKKRENEILKIRQKVNLKLNQGRNIYSIMRIFKWKVESFIRNYSTEFCYGEEKYWRDKVVITEKAVARSRNERRATINAARAQELLVENLPEPPDTRDDKIEEKLERLKNFKMIVPLQKVRKSKVK